MNDFASMSHPLPFRDELRAIYAELEAEIQALAPVCVASGRCCRFKEYGHTLFLSAPEAALLTADAPSPARGLDEGESCPWQDERGLCLARDARPLGCRVYFCDPSYQEHAHALSEKYLGRLKRLTEANRLSWSYAPLHVHLKKAAESGLFRDPAANTD
jgi:Fe-S-cluster containining protein